MASDPGPALKVQASGRVRVGQSFLSQLPGLEKRPLSQGPGFLVQ